MKWWHVGTLILYALLFPFMIYKIKTGRIGFVYIDEYPGMRPATWLERNGPLTLTILACLMICYDPIRLLIRAWKKPYSTG